METRIFDLDTIHEIAYKIFHFFELNQSCTITGLVQVGERQLVPKGELVLKELKELDLKFNTNKSPYDKRPRRKRVVLPNTIGGYVAQKIFKYKEQTIDNDIRYMIWRIQ